MTIRLAAVEARENGFDDAILLTRAGKVAEATGAALLMVRDGQLVVPPVTDGVLESITRRSVLELYAREYGRPSSARSTALSSTCATRSCSAARRRR